MLYLLPDELLVAIAEYCDQRSRKSLSLVSRRLRDPSQRIILKTVWFTGDNFGTIVPKCAAEATERLSEVIHNDRFLSYIQTLVIFPRTPFHHLEMSTVEALFTVLHRMQPLRDIELINIPLTTTMLDHLFEVLSIRLYNVQLYGCSYPDDYTIQQAALKIQRLGYGLGPGTVQPATTKMVAAIAERSQASIVCLTLSSGWGGLAYFGRMPRLTQLVLLDTARSGENLIEFLVANPQLVDLVLERAVYDLSLLPSSALPNLGRIRARAYMMHDIVPGRPVVAVDIYDSSPLNVMLHGLRVLTQSTAPITELTMHTDHCSPSVSEILDVVVETMPHLEKMSLSFHGQVRSILYYDALKPLLTTIS
jgi:hypothetical protein